MSLKVRTKNNAFLNFSCIICNAITILCIVHFVFFTAFHYGKQIIWSVSSSRGLFSGKHASRALFPGKQQKSKKHCCYINVSNWLDFPLYDFQYTEWYCYKNENLKQDLQSRLRFGSKICFRISFSKLDHSW